MHLEAEDEKHFMRDLASNYSCVTFTCLDSMYVFDKREARRGNSQD